MKALLKLGPTGKLELHDHLKLWYFPPQPSCLYHQAPAPDRFFAHPLLVWMPYKLWRVKVVCPNPACRQHQLTGAGLHKRARGVLDVDRTYNMVTETLTCTKCRSTHVSWSQTVLTQLDLAHRSEFRVILTQKWVTYIFSLALSSRILPQNVYTDTVYYQGMRVTSGWSGFCEREAWVTAPHGF